MRTSLGTKRPFTDRTNAEKTILNDPPSAVENELDPSQQSNLVQNYAKFSLIDYYEKFQYGNQSDGEKAFTAAIGTLRRSANTDLKKWANKIASNDFEIIRRANATEYWRKLRVSEKEKENDALAIEAMYEELNQRLKQKMGGSGPMKPSSVATTKRRRASSGRVEVLSAVVDRLIQNAPNTSETPNCQWSTDLDTCFRKFQLLAATAIAEQTEEGVPLEMHIHELLAIQGILLVKPEQHSKMLLDAFGGNDSLADLHGYLTKKWLMDCPEFTAEYGHTMQTLVDKYQTKHIRLKEVTAGLADVALKMNEAESRATNAIRRLLERVPCKTLLDIDSFSETDIWSTFADPVLSSLMSDPENGIHLRWTNKKVKGAEQLIRPDAIVSLIKQLRWGGHAGVGEVKISEPTSNNYNLALDLVRISMLSKTLVNSEDLKAVLGFQVNGFHITFYLMELLRKGIYTVVEIGDLELPSSVDKFDSFTTNKSLRTLVHLAHTLSKLPPPPISKNDVQGLNSMKIPNMVMDDFEALISLKRDRSLPCVARF